MGQDLSKYRIGTLAIHAGQHRDAETQSIAQPIYQTTAYGYRSTDEAAALFNLEQSGYMYTRLANPTTSVFESRCAAMEGGSGAAATASGQQAAFVAILNVLGDLRGSLRPTPQKIAAAMERLCERRPEGASDVSPNSVWKEYQASDAGPHIVASSMIYGGTTTLFTKSLESLGIRTELVDPRDPQNFAKAIRPCTRVVFIETVANPSNCVLDYEAIAQVAHGAGVPLIVDNTVMTPYLFRPLDHGADIVTYSATKFLGGHGTCMGGVVIDGGRFDWTKDPDRWPHLTRPDVAYHGVNFCERFGTAAFATRCISHLLRDYGGTLSPMSAFLFLQGLETLHIRMQRHCENAMALARWLETHPQVAWVNYPGLPSHPQHALAKRYLTRGFGAMLAFGVRGGRESARRFIESLKLAIHATNLGDVRTLVTHPASTTHRQLSDDELVAGGVSSDLIRVSVGIEDIEDIRDDFDQALNASLR